MLNEEKIRLMTELAVFEKKNEADMKAAAGYFKCDFVSRHLIQGFVCYSLCGVMLLGIWVLFHMDAFLSTIGIETLLRLVQQGILLYLTGLVLYLICVWVVYSRRYDYAARMNKIYLAKLKHLDKRYEYHNRSRELAREGRRV